ncbi:hypothetical protein D3C87_403790 [compost metagenome]
MNPTGYYLNCINALLKLQKLKNIHFIILIIKNLWSLIKTTDKYKKENLYQSEIDMMIKNR